MRSSSDWQLARGANRLTISPRCLPGMAPVMQSMVGGLVLRVMALSHWVSFFSSLVTYSAVSLK